MVIYKLWLLAHLKLIGSAPHVLSHSQIYDETTNVADTGVSLVNLECWQQFLHSCKIEFALVNKEWQFERLPASTSTGYCAKTMSEMIFNSLLARKVN